MRNVAPFRVAPYFRTRPWGFHDLSPWYRYKTTGEPVGEVWLTGEMCVAETGPFAGRTLKEITADNLEPLLGTAAAHTSEFPLLVKVLFPKEKLSVQVHPDDALARQYGEPRGKTECWYALDAEPGASVALGIKSSQTKDSVRQAIENSSLEDLLEWIPVSKGDMIFVDAGTVHAIAPGSVLLETQQTSDLTYRMYDYGRPRELHLEQSFAAMRLKTRAGKVPPRKTAASEILIEELYFAVERWPVFGKVSQSLTAPLPTIEMLFVSSGECEISGGDFDTFPLSRGQLAIVPASSAPWELTATQAGEIIRIRPGNV